MTTKKHMRIWIAGVAAVLLIVAIIVYSVNANRTPSVADESSSSTKGSAWLDETFPNNSIAENEEHTLPMITVG